MCYPPAMLDTPGHGYRLVEPDPELLRIRREECELKDEARRAARKQVRGLQRGQQDGPQWGRTALMVHWPC